jgi:hypothetical protein
MNKKKPITIKENYAIVDISTKKFPNTHCIIDLEDIEKIKNINWSPNINGYAHGGSYKKFLMHRFILNAKKGQIIDHINGNILDNRKVNLRLVTHQQNLWNNTKNKSIVTSRTGTKYVGVSLSPVALRYKLKRPYVARMTVDNKTVNLGYYETPEQASNAYQQKAKEIKGQYIRNYATGEC